MQSWEEFIKETITLFRKQFDLLSADTQDLIRSNFFEKTLNEPCQIDFSHFEKGGTMWVITHDSELEDMKITVKENIVDREKYIKKYFEENTFLRNHTSFFKDIVITPNSDNFTIMLFQDADWLGSTDYPRSPSRHAQGLLQHAISHSTKFFAKKQHAELKESAEILKKEVSFVTEKKVRSRLEAISNRIDETLEQIKRIEEHDMKIKLVQDDLKGVRRLIGTETFGEWKNLISEIDKLNLRIDSFSNIRDAYDKVLTQQNEFMAQQSEVMKTQSSFINWIKYATILVPIAVVSVPIIEIILRHFLGIP